MRVLGDMRNGCLIMWSVAESGLFVRFDVTLLSGREKVQHPLHEQRRRLCVVRRQRTVCKVVLITRVQEQFCLIGCFNKRPSRIDVALAHKDRIGVHPCTCTGTSFGQADPNSETGTQA